MYYFKFNINWQDYESRLMHLKMHSREQRRLEIDEIVLYNPSQQFAPRNVQFMVSKDGLITSNVQFLEHI